MVRFSLWLLLNSELRTCCSPGRFFAANELKSMMAHVVMTYDVSMEKPGHIPQPVRIGAINSPNRTAKVLFKKRRD